MLTYFHMNWIFLEFFLHKIGNKSKITFECFDKITDIKKDLKR